MTNIVDRVRSFAEAIIGFFRRIFEEVIGGSYWTDTVDGVVSFSRDLIGLALPFIEDFRENVVAIFEAISTVVGNVIDNIREAFAAAGQDVTVGNVEQADQGNAFIGVAALGASIAGAFALESTRTAIGNAFSAGLSFLQPVALLTLADTFGSDIAAALMAVDFQAFGRIIGNSAREVLGQEGEGCLLYTSPSPRDS